MQQQCCSSSSSSYMLQYRRLFCFVVSASRGAFHPVGIDRRIGRRLLLPCSLCGWRCVCLSRGDVVIGFWRCRLAALLAVRRVVLCCLLAECRTTTLLLCMCLVEGRARSTRSLLRDCIIVWRSLSPDAVGCRAGLCLGVLSVVCRGFFPRFFRDLAEVRLPPK